MIGPDQPSDSAKQLTQRLDIDFALQAAGLGVWELDPNTHQVLWDDRCRQLFGLAKDNHLLYHQAIKYIHPDDVDRVNQAVQWATNPQSGGFYDQTYRTLGADDGQLRWVRFYGRGYFSPDGQSYRFAGVAQEVTQQVLIQQALDQQQAQQRFLLQLSDELRSLTDPLDVYYHAACLLGDYLGADRVGYAEDQGDGNTIVVLRNYVNGVADLQGRYQYADYGPLLAEFLAGHTVVRPDIALDPTLTDAQKEAHRALELGATVNKPLFRDGQLVAVLFIHYKEAHAWSPDELALLDAVAERLVVAVDRTRAEETLRQSEERFRLLANSIPQAIWETDPEGNVLFLNKWWTDYSGIPFEGTTAWQIAATILHPQDGPMLVAAFQEAMRTGKGFEVEQRNRSALGEYRWFLNRGEPYFDPKTGQLTKWIGVSIDIHDRRLAEQLLQESEVRYRQLSTHLERQVQERTEELASLNGELTTSNQEIAAANEELEESNQHLVRSNENLQQFAYVASHDLQEPLRKIQAFGDLLVSQYAGQLGDGMDYLERMQAAAARMSTLIKDLLTFSRISNQRETSDLIALNTVVQAILTDLDLAIAEAGAVIQVDPLPTVEGDRTQLEQLFQNLLSNALKFRQPGVAVQIQIRVRQVSQEDLPEGIRPTRKATVYHHLEVIDNGIGFEEKYLDRLFQVFQRLHGRSEYAGTGIGLAICEKVVANHGGAITASSQVGKGARFSIYLPA